MMLYRQKVLLALVECLEGKVKDRDLQNYLFLFIQKYHQEKLYEFVPYKYGCFSFQSYADRRNLTKFGHLMESEDWVLNDTCYMNQLKRADALKIEAFNKEGLIYLSNVLILPIFEPNRSDY
ncbi:MAG: hypothetical protein V6Z81_09060 [Parvularculales bacterium]